MLAACIKDQAQTIIFDPDPDDAQLTEIVAFQPDLVGIGFMTQTRVRALEIHKVLREKLPHAKFVLGGVGPTVEPDKTFALFQPDALVVGEGSPCRSAGNFSAATFPKTIVSSKEFPPKRFAPCTETQAHSPAAYRPGTGERPSWSTSIPPME